MKKDEFIELLNYYFRHCDQDDLKGILADCSEQFRLGAKQGLSEEEVCCKLGHPKNIYRYYMGQPIVPEDNASLAYHEPEEGAAPEAAPRKAAQFYDWEKDPDHLRRLEEEKKRRRTEASSRSADRREAPHEPPRHRPSHGPRQGRRDDQLQWNSSSSAVPQAAKAIASPFLDIIGALLGIASTLMFFVFALSLLAALAIYNLPPYLFSDLLPLPTLSVSTMAFSVLAVLFAALTLSYASQACHRTAHNARNTEGGGK